ncbi:2,3-bisphosphoglycerate-dependent phosphoglycerate mutase [Paraburkholderia sp. J12]|uniref:2,3-bisphosphoglycerate-dependent phosphoglycerate mutase n=1 Tax=Paraburkholderia sp. J12 TaxID=2805432 RepID=UPI002ABDB1D1|nr:2,3-bisphosphoglycerate-dependent phosphoglycerate mutase [Paraburkholderia sp. J12]
MNSNEHCYGPCSLVLVRHGESEWNRIGRFTGWMDVDLTQRGESQARGAGQLLAREGWQFDLAYTSMLKRSVRSQWLILEALDQTWVPVLQDWRLNERHYGDLTGKLKTEAIQTYGTQEILHWRRSYRGTPPPLPTGDPRDVSGDRRYRYLRAGQLPSTESLHDTVTRVREFWRAVACPAIRSGQRLIICGHGNSLRSLIQIIDGISDYETSQLDIPNGVPLVYWFDRQMRPTCRCYLEEPVSGESNIL